MWGPRNALMSVFKWHERDFPSLVYGGSHVDKVVRGRRGACGRRSTCSDTRVGYRLSDFRPGLVPVLRRASAQSWPPSVARERPAVGPPPTLHDSCFVSISIASVEPRPPDY